MLRFDVYRCSSRNFISHGLLVLIGVFKNFVETIFTDHRFHYNIVESVIREHQSTPTVHEI